MNWYLEVLKKYVTFQGRASRSEFWYFNLFNVLINILFFIGIFLALSVENVMVGQVIYMVSLVYMIGVLLPNIAVSVRRLHDIGKSGWWYFIILVPFVGVFVLLYFFVQDSQINSNYFGENPKDGNRQQKENAYSQQGITGPIPRPRLFPYLIPENKKYPKILLYNGDQNSNRRWITIGRDNTSDIVIADDYVSGKHASVMFESKDNTLVPELVSCFGVLYIKDLGSTNGTYLDGKKISMNEIVAVSGDMRIILGSE